MNKIAVVTGGTSGIGAECVSALRESGYKIYTMSRRSHVHNDDMIEHIALDVADEVAVKSAFNRIAEHEGKLDLLVVCAGYGISGAVEFTGVIEAKKQFDVNFFGAFICMREAGTIMRKQRSGRMIVVSSVAGEIAIPFQAFYSASKAALSKLTEAYGAELSPYGVSCTVVMPGDICTPFTDMREKSPAGDNEYGGRIARSISKMETDERKGISPRKLGRFIAKIVDKKRIKPYYGYNYIYAILLLVYRFLPRKLVLSIVKGMYAGK